MARTMSRVDLVADLKDALADAASIFTAAADADFQRHLDIAALDFARVRPRTLLGSITPTAGESDYPAPADCRVFKVSIWGSNERRNTKPWDEAWPGSLPKARLVETAEGLRLWLDPAPSARQITLLGATWRFYYRAAHSIGTLAADTTIAASDRHLLLLRAGAEAMLEMTKRNAHRPVQMRGELVSLAKNQTPAALYKQMMQQFEHQGGLWTGTA